MDPFFFVKKNFRFWLIHDHNFGYINTKLKKKEKKRNPWFKYYSTSAGSLYYFDKWWKFPIIYIFSKKKFVKENEE